MNERNTENIVRNILNNNKIKYPKVKIEEQKSKNRRIAKLLKHASKSGLGRGSPEFIIRFEEIPDLLVVIECKADPQKHESENRDKPNEYAVDGVLHYSEYLAKEFDVVSIAVSGEKKSELKVSTFMQLQANEPINKPDKQILEFEDYISMYRNDPKRERLSVQELINYSKKLNNKLRDDFELEEGHRPLLVSGILIALTDEAFTESYQKEKRAVDLAKSLTETIEKVLDQQNVEQQKKVDMITIYKFIETNYNIARGMNEQENTKLRELITEINQNAYVFMNNYRFHDILGQFYNEFLRYANGDGGLGIVLTPKHLTDLFVDLANVHKDSIVLDNCCGTGGFLISSMKKMIEDAGSDINKIQKINAEQLIGIDNNDKMFCLACSNMILRGDGKTNIHHNTCFEINKDTIQKFKPTVGLLNPPYSKKKEGSKELNYVINCMEFLQPNGTCMAVVPIRCAIENSELKKKLLQKHTLEAVMSMPDELFYPKSVVTCIMVFKAHVPHDESVETWFGYWKEDGFIKNKSEGRVDKNNKFKEIRENWLDKYKNKRNEVGMCIRQKVGADSEWCAEAYMETDYSIMTKEDFEKDILNYVMFKTVNGV